MTGRVDKGTSSRPTGAISPSNINITGKSRRKLSLTLDDERKSVRSKRTSASTLTAAAASSSPIARENVISPSKMKQRSRKAGTKPKPKLKPPTTALKSVAREGRDEKDSGRPSAGHSSSSPRSTPRASSSSRRSVGAPSPKRPPASATRSPRSSSARKSSKLEPKRPPGAVVIDKENKEEKMSVVINKKNKAQATQLGASAAAKLLLHEDETRQSRLQKKLMSNLREPDPSLADLLSVLTDFEQTSHLRRVNACGAIKTLTLHKSNQIPLARTRGVVPSLTSVLCAVNATEEERTRCINALMHLCVPEENWKLIFLFPQTPEALARNMADKYPQIRYAACLATSFLAKKNRREVIRNRLLMYAMARALEVDKNGALERMSGQDKKVFVGARLCVLKMLLHLSKNKDVSDSLARTECIVGGLVCVANTMETAANILCVAIMTNLTRHPDNSYHLVYKVPGLVSSFVQHVEYTSGHHFNENNECAKCALFALQNLSCTGNCRQELANIPDLLSNVTKAAFRHDCPEQQLSALHTLKNLSDDPFNLVTMTNTPGCTATLLALANNDASCSSTPEISSPRSPRSPRRQGSTLSSAEDNAMAQYLACDTLATLSHWLLTLSATRKSKEGGERSGGIDVNRRTFKQCTWESWN